MKKLSKLLVVLTILAAMVGCGTKDDPVEPKKIREELKISVTPEKPKAGETITFSVQLAEAPEKCVWEYGGENSPYVDKGKDLKKFLKINYDKEGTYTVKFTVTYEDGSEQTVSTDIVVEKKPEPDGANNKMTLTVEKEGDKVTFNFDTPSGMLTHVWVDVNNNGKKDEGEKGASGYAYTCQSTTVNIYGPITRFDIFEGRNVKTFDASGNTDLLKLKLRNCDKLTSFDISKNTKLEKLAIDNTYAYGEVALKSMDISKNTNLQYLSLDRLKLEALDVSKNTKLLKIHLYNAEIPALDLSKNTELKYLFCYSAGISKLDLSKNTKLKDLYCSENKISSLNLSANTELTSLGCSNNLITELDISKNTKIVNLYCNDNPELSKLNVANGNNTNFKTDSEAGVVFDATNCPKLKCIQVDKGYTPKETGKKNLWKKDDSASWNNSGSACTD